MEERLAADSRVRRMVLVSGFLTFFFGSLVGALMIAGAFDSDGPGLVMDWGRIGIGLVVGLWSCTMFTLAAAAARLLERIEEPRPPSVPPA